MRDLDTLVYHDCHGFFLSHSDVLLLNEDTTKRHSTFTDTDMTMEILQINHSLCTSLYSSKIPCIST